MPWVNSNRVDIVPTVYAGYKYLIFSFCTRYKTSKIIYAALQLKIGKLFFYLLESKFTCTNNGIIVMNEDDMDFDDAGSSEEYQKEMRRNEKK